MFLHIYHQYSFVIKKIEQQKRSEKSPLNEMLFFFVHSAEKITLWRFFLLVFQVMRTLYIRVKVIQISQIILSISPKNQIISDSFCRLPWNNKLAPSALAGLGLSLDPEGKKR